MAEPFSWSKLWSGFANGVGWIKAASLGVRFAVILAILAIPAYTYYKGYKQAKAKYYASRYMEGYNAGLKWADEHPKQIISGSTVNNNVCPVIHRVGLVLGPLGTIGWCK